jgi:hypothetical protein
MSRWSCLTGELGFRHGLEEMPWGMVGDIVLQMWRWSCLTGETGEIDPLGCCWGVTSRGGGQWLDVG